MKRTCLQKNTKTDEKTTCEPALPSGRFHRVRMWSKEMKYNLYRCFHIGTRRVDFFIEEKISVELKAVSTLDEIHLAQALNYLEAYNLEVGLLINFGERSLKFKRLLNKKYKV